QKTDRQDAQLILRLMLKDDFPQIWVPSWENRDLRQLLWHRHRMVQVRTRIMNQLQALAMNEGLRSKNRLWREHGRRQLESFRLAPWASRRRRDLLELLDRLNPTIAELSQAIEQEGEKCPEAQRLMTHPGVGPLTALAFVLIIGQGAFSVWEAGCQLSGTGTARKVQRETTALGAHHETREFDGTLSTGGSGPSCRTRRSSVAQQVFASTDAPRTKDGESSDGAPISHWFVLDVA